MGNAIVETVVIQQMWVYEDGRTEECYMDIRDVEHECAVCGDRFRPDCILSIIPIMKHYYVGKNSRHTHMSKPFDMNI